MMAKVMSIWFDYNVSTLKVKKNVNTRNTTIYESNERSTQRKKNQRNETGNTCLNTIILALPIKTNKNETKHKIKKQKQQKQKQNQKKN